MEHNGTSSFGGHDFSNFCVVPGCPAFRGGAALRGRVVEVLPCAVLLEELSGSSARYLALRQGLEELRVGTWRARVLWRWGGD